MIFTQLNNWKRYISWEESNPLMIEDKQILYARVSYAYKQALLSLKYFHELWFDYYTFLKNFDRADEAFIVLKQGLEAIPTSLLINFTLAEHYETMKSKFEDIQTLFGFNILTIRRQFVGKAGKRSFENDRKVKVAARITFEFVERFL